jgi:hypothetical protein
VAYPVYLDLLVVDDDLALDDGGEPQLITDRHCIEQDIKHLIRESGLVVLLIGERDAAKRAGAVQQLQLMIEDDERLVPGTIFIIEQALDRYFIVAETVAFGTIEFIVSF